MDPAEIASLFTINDVKFATTHYWNRHLACYVHTKYTSSTWDRGLIGPDFKSQRGKPVSPVSVEFIGLSTIIDDAGTSTQFGYRVSLLSSIVTGTLTVNVYYVGTSFLEPRRVDCPKPYPNYP